MLNESRTKAIVLFLLCVSVSLASWFWVSGGAAYTYALLHEPWEQTTIDELEGSVWLREVVDITREYQDSELGSWASGRKLKEGERVLRYNLLWSAPLDIIVRKGQIIRFYTSYE